LRQRGCALRGGEAQHEKAFCRGAGGDAVVGVGSVAQSSQQVLMRTCNVQATNQKLTGDTRKAFMRKCLSSKLAANLTPQQQKMQSSNARTAAQKLTGDVRKKFMSGCVSS
jgi:hypothetical protein